MLSPTSSKRSMYAYWLFNDRIIGNGLCCRSFILGPHLAAVRVSREPCSALIFGVAHTASSPSVKQNGKYFLTQYLQVLLRDLYNGYYPDTTKFSLATILPPLKAIDIFMAPFRQSCRCTELGCVGLCKFICIYFVDILEQQGDPTHQQSLVLIPRNS